MAAIDLVNRNIPGEAKLAEGIARLAANGLLCAREGGLALTPAAEQIIEALPRKAGHEERLVGIKDRLSLHRAKGESAPVDIAAEELRTAMLAHRTAAAGTAKNLLVPKAKPEDKSQSRPGQRQRKPLPARKRRD